MSLTNIRRKDRAITDDAWITDFLREEAVITLGFCQDDQPFLFPTLYAFDEARRVVYIHATNQGRTAALARNHPKASATVFRMGRLLPAKRALNFSVEYASVMLFGRASLVEGEEAARALQMIMDKYAPHLQPDADYLPAQPEDLKITAVIRLDIETWIGKQKQVAEDFPGAFHYGAQSAT